MAKVYEGILQKLTPEYIDRIVVGVNDFELSPRLKDWVDQYSQVGERKMFIWKWLYKINLRWKQTEIQSEFNQSLAETKTLYNMFIILLDDIAEMKDQEGFLQKLVAIPFGKSYDISNEYYLFTKRVWAEILKNIKTYPFYKKARDFFEYDTQQFINAVLYANLIYRRPEALNEKEFWLYIPFSMQIIIDLDLDLMCGIEFLDDEIGRARTIILTLQEMARVGNWLSTWEREAQEGDYTSLVVARAVEMGIVNHAELRKKDKSEVVNKIRKSNSEKYLLEEWEKRYSSLKSLSLNSKIINKKEVLKKAQYLLMMHLTSRGHK